MVALGFRDVASLGAEMYLLFRPAMVYPKATVRHIAGWYAYISGTTTVCSDVMRTAVIRPLYTPVFTAQRRCAPSTFLRVRTRYGVTSGISKEAHSGNKRSRSSREESQVATAAVDAMTLS